MDIDSLVVDNLLWLKRKAQQFCYNDFDIEDLVSETIEKMLVSRDRFDSRKDFRPWAMIIMRNTFITQYNRRKCLPFVGMDEEYMYASPYTADQEIAVSRIISIIRDCARKSVAIECVMLYAKGYNYDEIAQILGIPIGTVMSRISNGRKMIRAALE